MTSIALPAVQTSRLSAACCATAAVSAAALLHEVLHNLNMPTFSMLVGLLLKARCRSVWTTCSRVVLQALHDNHTTCNNRMHAAHRSTCTAGAGIDFQYSMHTTSTAHQQRIAAILSHGQQVNRCCDSNMFTPGQSSWRFRYRGESLVSELCFVSLKRAIRCLSLQRFDLPNT
jgi:hypothetical protein